MMLPLFGYSNGGLCLKEKGFNYRANVQYQDSFFSNTCYITNKQILSSQAVLDPTFDDLGSEKNQNSKAVTSAVSYFIVKSLKLPNDPIITIMRES